MKESRAVYTWGIDGSILWLEDHGEEHRSLTNDIDRCLMDLSTNLPNDKSLFDYTIIYRDSEGQWDGVEIIGSIGNQVDPRRCVVRFFPIGQNDYKRAKQTLLKSPARTRLN